MFQIHFDTLKSVSMTDNRKSSELYEMCKKWHKKVSNTDVSKTYKCHLISCPILIGSKVYQSSARDAHTNDLVEGDSHRVYQAISFIFHSQFHGLVQFN